MHSSLLFKSVMSSFVTLSLPEKGVNVNYLVTMSTWRSNSIVMTSMHSTCCYN